MGDSGLLPLWLGVSCVLRGSLEAELYPPRLVYEVIYRWVIGERRGLP